MNRTPRKVLFSIALVFLVYAAIEVASLLVFRLVNGHNFFFPEVQRQRVLIAGSETRVED